jgi:hypothetical protein
MTMPQILVVVMVNANDFDVRKRMMMMVVDSMMVLVVVDGMVPEIPSYK